jgi:mRNA interferase RelE/StbE
VAYKISIKPSALKDLDALPRKEVLNILQRVEQLKSEARPIGIQKLTNEEGYRIRSGRYRVLFEINDKTQVIFILRIKHRKDIYRQ